METIVRAKTTSAPCAAARPDHSGRYPGDAMNGQCRRRQDCIPGVARPGWTLWKTRYPPGLYTFTSSKFVSFFFLNTLYFINLQNATPIVALNVLPKLIFFPFQTQGVLLSGWAATPALVNSLVREDAPGGWVPSQVSPLPPADPLPPDQPITTPTRPRKAINS